jgi:hypothetical protein
MPKNPRKRFVRVMHISGRSMYKRSSNLKFLMLEDHKLNKSKIAKTFHGPDWFLGGAV